MTLNLSEYRGKVIIVVNVASQCGFTNQYEDMQRIWEKYQKKNINQGDRFMRRLFKHQD